QLFSDVNCIALWISSEKILTRLYSVLHWFHKRLEANVKKPRENRCFQTVIVFSFGSFDNSNKCTVLWKIAARLITVSTSVNKEMWVKLSSKAPILSDRSPPYPFTTRDDFFPFFPAAPQTFLALCRYILIMTYRSPRDPIHEPTTQLAPLPTARGPASAPAAPGRVPGKRTAPPRLALHTAAKVRQTQLPLQPR